jgi:hypothetical protein
VAAGALQRRPRFGTSQVMGRLGFADCWGAGSCRNIQNKWVSLGTRERRGERDGTDGRDNGRVLRRARSVGWASIHERIGFEVNWWQACSAPYFLNTTSAALCDDTKDGNKKEMGTTLLRCRRKLAHNKSDPGPCHTRCATALTN